MAHRAAQAARNDASCAKRPISQRPPNAMIQKKPDLAAFSCLATDDAEGLARLVETWPDWEERAMCVSKGVEQTLLERAIEIAPQCARFLAGKSQGRQQDRQEKKTLSMALMRAIEAQNAE